MDSLKLTKEELFKKAQERFNSWAKMYSDQNVTAQQMYEDMACSCYSGDTDTDTNLELDTECKRPVLDQDLCFNYRGYQFGFTSCNCITAKEQMLGLTNENFNERFPLGVFTDRYVCWMFGHKDFDGHTKEESDEPEHWTPEVYLVSGAWSWGAVWDLNPGNVVEQVIIDAIDKFLETFKE